jgi:hypothetical protein
MKIAVVAVVFAAAAFGAARIIRHAIRRHRRIRRLERAEATVAAAVADGRMATATGQALLQHLEGLRRECSGGGEG